MGDKNEYITYKQLVSVWFATVSIIITIAWTMYKVHNATPHPTAASQYEINRLHHRILEIEKGLDLRPSPYIDSEEGGAKMWGTNSPYSLPQHHHSHPHD